MAFLIPHPINTSRARFPCPGNARQQRISDRFFIFQILVGQSQCLCRFLFIDFALL